MMKALLPIIGICLLNLGNANAETIELNDHNTVTLRGVVDQESIARTQVELLKRAKPGKRLCLVLDTPGGSVDAGNMLIETAKGLPGRVDTVTIFAASMGFQIAQNLGERLILDNGTLMSHRAYTGVEGQLPGELITRVAYYTQMCNRLDRIASARMGMTYENYRRLIYDEYWTIGSSAVAERAADRVVSVRCGEGMQGTEDVEFQTMFGSVDVTFSKCPLVTGPLAVKFKGEAQYRNAAVNEVRAFFIDRQGYDRKFIRK